MGKSTFGNDQKNSRLVFKGRPVEQLTAHALSNGEALANDGAGLYTLSGTAAISASLPPADKCAGSEFIFRSLSPHAHFLTGSGISSNADALALVSGVTQGTSGALDAVIGSSVVLKSDGLHYLVLQSSGSFTVS